MLEYRAFYHKSQSMNGELTKIEDIVSIVKFLATEGWLITGQTLFANCKRADNTTR